MSSDKFVIVRQSINESEDALSYSPVKYFSDLTEADYFAMKCKCEPGDVLYVYDIACVSKIPNGAIYAYVFDSAGDVVSIGSSRKKYLYDWISGIDNTYDLMYMARVVNVSEEMISKCVYECIKSVSNMWGADKLEIDRLLFAVKNSKKMTDYSQYTKLKNKIYEEATELRMSAKDRESSDRAKDHNCATCANAILLYNDNRYSDSADVISDIDANVNNLIKSIITTKVFIIALAEMGIGNTE